VTTTVEFRSRPYAGDSDLPIIEMITNTSDAFDQLDEGTSITELTEDYSAPTMNPAEDLRIWLTADGQPAAYGEIHAPHGEPAEIKDAGVFVWFKVLPDLRGVGLEEQIIAWGEERRTRVRAQLGIPVALEAMARDIEQPRAAILTGLGFRPHRYFLRMSRPITGELAAPTLPEGFSIRAGELSDEGYMRLHNEVWVDHFGYEPWTLEDVAHYRSLGYYDATLDLVAYAPDGTPAGFCWASIHAEENARSGRNDGWIGLLGVKREHRAHGLGRALLREGMHRLRAQGAEFARLGVDGASPTNATKLYASEGFETNFTRVLYAR
jgi:mycothiol synthase